MKRELNCYDSTMFTNGYIRRVRNNKDMKIPSDVKEILSSNEVRSNLWNRDDATVQNVQCFTSGNLQHYRFSIHPSFAVHPSLAFFRNHSSAYLCMHVRVCVCVAYVCGVCLRVCVYVSVFPSFCQAT